MGRTCANDDTNSRSIGSILRTNTLPYPDDFGSSIQEALGRLALDIAAISPTHKNLVADRELANRHRLARKHALVDDSISREEEYVCRYDGELGFE